MAQMPIFEAIPEMIMAIDANNKAKQDVRNAAIAAKKQLVLYYMVDKLGWQAALHTIGNTVDKKFGMSKIEHPPTAPIQQRPAPARSSNYGYRPRGQTYRKPSQPSSGGPPRR